MNIDEGKLQDLLARRAKHLKSQFDIITSFLALFNYAVTMIFTYMSIKDIPAWAKIISLILLVFYIALFIWTFFNSRYSVEAFYNDIVKCADDHRFSLVVLKDSTGRFLLKWDKRWKAWLFPYTRTTSDNDNSVFFFVKNSIGFTPFNIIKKLEKEETKHSFSSNMTKTYNHSFYNISFEPHTEKNAFRFHGTRYKWFSIDDMKCNKRIMERNGETVKFVEEHF